MKNLFSILITLSFCLCLSSLPVGGAFAAELYPKLAAVDAYLLENFPSTHMPGLSIVIVDADSVLYSKSYGNLESVETPFIIGSISKSFTAAAIMQLHEQGKVDLNAPVTSYLEIGLDDKVTISHLLNHTSGFNSYQMRKDLTIGKSYGDYSYANLNYTLLGEVIEAIAGLSYGDYIRSNVFLPLAMNSSYTSLSEAEDIAVGHRNLFGFPIKKEFPYPASVDFNSRVSVPTGYIISSAADIGRYLQAFLREGENILSPQSVNTLLYDCVPIPGTNEFYAMGWQETTDFKERLLYHSGLVENYFSIMALLPDSGLGIVTLYNMNDYFVANSLSTTLTIDVLNILMGAEPKGVGSSDYLIYHLLINLLLCLLLLPAIIPLLTLSRWKKRLKSSRPFLLFAGSIALNFLYPILLLSIPPLLGIPYQAAWEYAQDVIIVAILGAVLALICGAAKLAIWVRQR
ncbi:MAG: beta-lactamase family protein [Lachnospiraceae bacterium]|nr:beta-lactamase family protein [Lachnospiraceae bacterium]